MEPGTGKGAGDEGASNTLAESLVHQQLRTHALSFCFSCNWQNGTLWVVRLRGKGHTGSGHQCLSLCIMALRLGNDLEGLGNRLSLLVLNQMRRFPSSWAMPASQHQVQWCTNVRKPQLSKPPADTAKNVLC